MVGTIPASDIVNVLPGVVSAGGTGLDMVGLFLTNSARLPYGTPKQFASVSEVSDYFGPTADETARATEYFNGYIGKTRQPAFLWMAAYATAARAGWLRGAALGLTLTELQALTGVLTVSFAGVSFTSGTINLSTATSFSNAATIIQAAFTTPSFTVTYDSIADAFQMTSNATGASVTVTYGSGTISAGLKLTQATGAVVSPGAAIDVAATAMDAITALTQDFACFTHIFSADAATGLALATWNNGQDSRYLFVPWTSDSAAVSGSDTITVGYLVKQADLSGSAPVWCTNGDIAAFVLGTVASFDYEQTNGRTILANRRGTNLTADVTSLTVADRLRANGYNFYGTWGTATEEFTWLRDGTVSGDFLWIDSYVNQIRLNNQFQLSLMEMQRDVPQIPYNADGYEIIAAAVQSDIDDAVDFGTIRAGVTLDANQIQQITNLVGVDVSGVLFTRGWYLSVRDPGSTVRAARGSPRCIFVYTDGQSVQNIDLSSLMVQ